MSTTLEPITEQESEVWAKALDPEAICGVHIGLIAVRPGGLMLTDREVAALPDEYHRRVAVVQQSPTIIRRLLAEIDRLKRNSIEKHGKWEDDGGAVGA